VTGSASPIPEDGAIAGSAFTWQVDFHRLSTRIRFLAATTGSTELSFTVPDFEASEANTWLRIHLTVRDASGSSYSVYRDIFPGVQLSALTPSEPPIISGVRSSAIAATAKHLQADDGRTMVARRHRFHTGLGVHAHPR